MNADKARWARRVRTTDPERYEELRRQCRREAALEYSEALARMKSIDARERSGEFRALARTVADAKKRERACVDRKTWLAYLALDSVDGVGIVSALEVPVRD